MRARPTDPRRPEPGASAPGDGPGAITSAEAERQAAQARLDVAHAAPARNRLGQFATPPALASAIARYCVPLLPSRQLSFLDPAVGSGAFYSAFLRELGAERFERALGVEVDPRVARVARRVFSPLGLTVRTGDFTRLSPPAATGRFDLVVANPPYVRHHHLDAGEKARLRETSRSRTGLCPSGLAGLYCHFLLLADAWLAPGGLAVWLVPAEVLDVNYGAVVREYLTTQVDLVRVHRYAPASPLFGDALVTSAVLVFRKGPPPRRCTVSSGGTLTRAERSLRLAPADLGARAKWTALEAPLRTGVKANAPVPLSALFTIRRGIATGANAFFVRERTAALAAGIPPEVLRPVLPSPRRLGADVVEAAADGWPLLPSQLALLDIRATPGAVARAHPQLWRLLNSAEAAAIRQRYLLSRRTPWFAQEHRPPPPFLCTYMGRPRGDAGPFRFVWNRSNAVATNVYLMLEPVAPLALALARAPALLADVFEGLRAINPERLVAGGRTYGGELHKLEPRELMAVCARSVLDRLPSPLAAQLGQGVSA